MNSILDRYFHYSSLGSSLRTETIAGLSTFAAMAYIICIQPALFSGQMTGTATGMPFGALVTTTCIASAFGSILMGLLSNYPIGLAPGMGTNIRNFWPGQGPFRMPSAIPSITGPTWSCSATLGSIPL